MTNQSLDDKLKDKVLSEKMEIFKNEVAKIQLDANGKGYNIDLERIVILMETAVDTLQRYENA